MYVLVEHKLKLRELENEKTELVIEVATSGPKILLPLFKFLNKHESNAIIEKLRNIAKTNVDDD